jgi:hypothetical protein
MAAAMRIIWKPFAGANPLVNISQLHLATGCAGSVVVLEDCSK